MIKDLVSIVIPVFNASSFIEETINCFLNQNYTNWEIIIQDDCSNDGTWEILIEKFQHIDKIYLFRNETNLGIARNWNEAYKKIKGEFVVIFNADDIVPNNFLSTLILELKNKPYLDFCMSSYNYRVEKGNSFNLIPLNKRHNSGLIEDVTEKLFTGFPFSHVFTIHRKNHLDSLLLSNGDLFVQHQVCDFELWLRIGLQNKKGYFVDSVIGNYRLHSSNNSSKKDAEFSGNIVVFNHHRELKNQIPLIYKKWIFNDLKNHIKLCIKQIRLPHFPSTFRLIKYYFK